MKSLDKKALTLFWADIAGVTLLIFSIPGAFVLHALFAALGYVPLLKQLPSIAIFLVGALLIGLAIISLSYVGALLAWQNFTYDFTQTGYHQRSGIFFTRDIVIPYSRMIEIEIKQGPLSKALNMCRLVIHTAGVTSTGKTTGTLGGTTYLPLEEAMKVRQEVLRHITIPH